MLSSFNEQIALNVDTAVAQARTNCQHTVDHGYVQYTDMLYCSVLFEKVCQLGLFSALVDTSGNDLVHLLQFRQSTRVFFTVCLTLFKVFDELC